jgi:hypothetical protein
MEESVTGDPELSAVLVTPDHYESIRMTVRHLLAQTARDRLELVIVAPSREALRPEMADLREFCSSRIVEIGPVPSVAAGYAAGVTKASAPVVAFVEEHS